MLDEVEGKRDKEKVDEKRRLQQIEKIKFDNTRASVEMIKGAS